MRDSDRYLAQAETVAGMAARAGSATERSVYQSIADGWRKLAAEARRNEGHEPYPQPAASNDEDEQLVREARG